jgi:alpha-ketoglutaric semialdehyde dehydrogenase
MKQNQPHIEPLSETLVEDDTRFRSVNPATGENLSQWFHITQPEELDKIVKHAEKAFRSFRKTKGRERAYLLAQIALEIENLGDSLVQICRSETGLTEARIIGERTRTINQIRLFADLLREGSWVNARIDTALPDRKPQPRPDLRQMQIAIGPVAVFEASNFPLAFSTAGGDTISALAAGCTVVVKSHSSHPGTSELVAFAIHRAIKTSGMPEGIFALVHGPGKKTGIELVKHSLIKAVGFTGSFNGGKSLFDAASKRVEPIPVYAEMGSINPVFLLPDAIKTNRSNIANLLIDSIVLSVGQFCTNPGILIMEDSHESRKLRTELKEKISMKEGATMLSQQIQNGFLNGVTKLNQLPEVKQIALGKDTGVQCQGIPQIFETTGQSFLHHEEFTEEIFGPVSLIVVAENKMEVMQLIDKLKGQLTATIHATEKDWLQYGELIHALEAKAGRLVVNGVPTGVEVCPSMIHGGPYPATTHAGSTSVGTMAIYRFTRPICYQDFPEALLPDELRNLNPMSISRLVNGRQHPMENL